MRFETYNSSIDLHKDSLKLPCNRGFIFITLLTFNIWAIIRWNNSIPTFRSSLLRDKVSIENFSPHIHPEWCPYAICKNSPLCQPCSRRWLIIIATGRSGSTTLMSMLSKLPGVRMAGEENGQLIYAKMFTENLDSKNLQFHSETQVHGAYQHNPIPEGSMICPIQQLFEVMNPPSQQQLSDIKGYEDSDTILGFKFIRFHDEQFGGHDMESALTFLQEYFPCSKFVINIRGDTESQKASWIKAFNPADEKVGDRLPRMNEMLRQVATSLGSDRARLLDMDEWSNGTTLGLKVLNDLVEWLGFDSCKFSTILHHHKQNYELDASDTFSLGEHCRFVGHKSL